MAPNPKTAWEGIIGDHGTSAGAGRSKAAPARMTVAEAAAEFLEAARRGSARDRYGHRFGAGAVRELTWNLKGHIEDRLGSVQLHDVRRRDIEALVQDLGAAGLSRRRLRAVVKSARALFDRAMERGYADRNPAERIALPEDDDAEQPTRERPQPRRRPQLDVDRLIGLVLQAATLCFALLALAFVAESL